MPDLESLNIKFKADSSSATSSIKKLTKSMKELKEASNALPVGAAVAVKALSGISSAASLSGKAIKGLGSVISNIKPSFKGLNTSIGNLKLGFIAFIAVARKLVQSLSSCVQESMNFVETMNLFNVSMGDNAIAAGEFAEKVQQIMGIDMAEWMRNQGVFQTLIEGFGVASEKADIMSQQVTQLGYDLSSLFNLPFAESMQKLQSGIAGELEPLRRLGFDLSQAKLQQIAYDHGIQQTVQTMTQAQKVQLRYYAIMTQVTTAHGDMARTIMQPANMLRILRQNVTIAARSIGNLLIPVMQKMMAVAIIVARGIAKVANAIAVLFGIDTADWREFVDDLDYSGDTFDDVEDGIDDVGSASGRATKKIKEFKKQFLGFDKINNITLPDPYTGKSGGGGGGNVGGGGDWDLPLPTYDFLQGLEDAFAETHPRLQKLFNDLATDFENGGKHIGQILGEALRDALKDINWNKLEIKGNVVAANIADGINKFLEVPGLFDTIGTTVGNALNTVFSAVKTWANVFHWDSLGEAIADTINGFFGTFKLSLVAETFSKVATGIINTIATAVGDTDFGKIATNISNGLKAIEWDNIKNGAKTLATNVAEGINDLLGQKSLFEDVGSTVANVLNTIFTTANTWANKFSWEKLGKAISSSVNKFFDDFDFALAATAISNWATGLLKSAKEAVKNVDWNKVGASIKDFISNLDIAGVISGTIELGLELLGAAAEMLPQIISGVLQAVLKLSVELFKKGWTTLKGWVLGNTTKEAVEQKVSLGKDFGGYNTVGGWVNDKNRRGKTTTTQTVGLGKDFGGYNTVTGWTNDPKQKGDGSVTEKVDLTKNFGKGINTVTGWTNHKDRKGDGSVTEKVDLEKSFGKGNATVTGWTNDAEQKGKGTVTQSVGLTKSFGKGNATVTGWANDYLGSGVKVPASIKKGGDLKKYGNVTDTVTKKYLGEGTVKLKANITSYKWNAGKINFAGDAEPQPKASGGLFKNGKWKPVTAAAGGGAFNTGQMFIAREAGPELVGRIGRSTAVMNNNQIVSSVAAGVASANAQQNSILSQILSAVQSGDAQVVLQVDSTKLGEASIRSINKVQRMNGRVMLTV